MWHYLFLTIYVAMIIGIATVTKKKIKGVSDFLLGGRNVNPWMSAFSYGTAYFSAVIFIGFAGKMGWSFGIPTMWIVVGNTIVGSFLAWQVLGKKTREMTHRLGASTMPSFLEKRYKSKNLESLTAFIIFFFLVPYSASIYKGLNFLFEGFGISPMNAYILMAAFVITSYSIHYTKLYEEDIGVKKVEKYLDELEKSAYISKLGDGYNITEKGSEMLKHKK